MTREDDMAVSMKGFLFLAVMTVLLILPVSALSESLWKDNELYSQKKFRTGDHIRVIFRDKQVVEFQTYQESYESASVTDPAGQGIINFLPALQAGNNNRASKNATMKNRSGIDISIMAAVQSVLSNGVVVITGNHSITVNNQVETVSVQGQVDPGRVNRGEVYADDVMNLALVYNRTVFKPALLQVSDLTNASSTSNRGLRDRKKTELLMRYFNQVLPLLFQ
jgi:hypothetical protein